MTRSEFIAAIENTPGGYNDPVKIVWPVIGRGAQRFNVISVRYSGTEVGGELLIVVSREA